jgi:phosphoglycolate phosphatase
MKNVFFDLDGTLIDPRDGIVKSISYALEKMEIDSPPESELERYIGPPLWENFENLLGTSDSQRIDEAVDWYRERFAHTGIVENTLYPGVPDVLKQLQNCGYRLYVVTSKPTHYARPIIKHHALQNHFADIYGCELDGTRTQKDQLIHYVLKQERISANTAVMVGDRRHDINGALANGVAAIGVTYGYGSKQELAGANWICDTPQTVFETVISLSTN